MITDESYANEYEHYEEQFNPLRSDRKARRTRRLEARHTPRKPPSQILTEIAEPTGLEGGFNTTYKPGRFEQGWLLSSLSSFYDQGLVSDVLAQIKGGKEANVYRCEAHPSTGMSLLAAKVYRPRMFRVLRNDSMYRQGREILTADGSVVKKSDHRIMRAIDKKTAFGVQVQHTSWLAHEYVALQRLYEVGGAVPRPIATSDNAILMSYCGDEHMGAPSLNRVALEQDEARLLLGEVLRNVELMLQLDLIHGDLSPYNILYWAGEITLIDFPQVTDCHTNSRAYSILQRDIRRVCDYFARQGVQCDAADITDELWSRCGQMSLHELAK